jgi:hypothetical protein
LESGLGEGVRIWFGERFGEGHWERVCVGGKWGWGRREGWKMEAVCGEVKSSQSTAVGSLLFGGELGGEELEGLENEREGGKGGAGKGIKRWVVGVARGGREEKRIQLCINKWIEAVGRFKIPGRATLD